jgi:hypothetical protein
MIYHGITNLNNSLFFNVKNNPEDWEINILNCSYINKIKILNCVSINNESKDFIFSSASISLNCNEINADTIHFNEQVSSNAFWNINSINTAVLNASNFNNCSGFSLKTHRSSLVTNSMIENLWYEDQMFSFEKSYYYSAGSGDKSWSWTFNPNYLYILDISCSVAAGKNDDNTDLSAYQISTFLIFNPNILISGARTLYQGNGWACAYVISCDTANTTDVSSTYIFTHYHMNNENFYYRLFKQPISFKNLFEKTIEPLFKITIKYPGTTALKYYENSSSDGIELANGTVTYYSNKLIVDLPDNWYFLVKDKNGVEIFYSLNKLNWDLDRDVIVEVGNTLSIKTANISILPVDGNNTETYTIYLQRGYTGPLNKSSGDSIKYLEGRRITFVKYEAMTPGASHSSTFNITLDGVKSSFSDYKKVYQSAEDWKWEETITVYNCSSITLQ